MSEDCVIELKGLGKMYKIFPNRFHQVMDALGLSRFGLSKVEHREFWALRGVDLALKPGGRIGIIGRNGAGKSTLLKVITGNLPPTEGKVIVRGHVHALLEAGAGFHPEFTGIENARAALTYQGMRRDEIEESLKDITQFTELEDFMNQPFKTYSLGMQARLTFATATAIKPKILIVDEVLGAGDAYFMSKSNERLRKLVLGGTSVLLVSHSLDHINMLCEEAIWLDRGRIVRTGPAMEVVKAYQQHIQVLEDRRLKSKRKKVASGRYRSTEFDVYSDTLQIRLLFQGAPGQHVEVGSVSLWRNGELDDQVLVGDAQDVEPTHSAFVVATGTQWSDPTDVPGTLSRKLSPGPGGSPGAGPVLFCRYTLLDECDYEVRLDYRCAAGGSFKAEVYENTHLAHSIDLPIPTTDWNAHAIKLGRLGQHLLENGKVRTPTSVVEAPEAVEAASGNGSKRTLSRWPGMGNLRIVDVKLVGAEDTEQGVFQVNTPMTLKMTFRASEKGSYPVLPAVTIYRTDGILVSNHVGSTAQVELDAGQQREARVEFGPLNLGNGYYVFSVALYRKLTHLEQPEVYDLIDRSYEFQVVGNGPFDNGVFRHPGEWKVL